MLHTKFQDHRPVGSRANVFKDFYHYGPGGHIGQVTQTR